MFGIYQKFNYKKALNSSLTIRVGIQAGYVQEIEFAFLSKQELAPSFHLLKRVVKTS